MNDKSRRQELGEFLRVRRARLQPEDVGLQRGPRRRTPGIRREELAQLAGVGLTWYTWIEQGRSIVVSPPVLESLANALGLDRDERRHLYVLANQRVPEQRDDSISVITPDLQRVLDALNPTPAFLQGERWDVLGWNEAAAGLLQDFEALKAEDRNLLWLLFTSLRDVLADWPQVAQAGIAVFRAEYALHLGEPAFVELVERCERASPEFRSWWAEHEVRDITQGQIAFNQLGSGHRLTLERVAFDVAGQRGVRLLVYLPAPPDSRRA